MSANNTLFNNQNLKANNVNTKNNIQNSKILKYAIIILIAILILVALLFLFGFRIKKCNEKTKEINNTNIINQQRIIRQQNKIDNQINSVNDFDGEKLRFRERRARDRREELRGGIPIPHREGLEERMKRPELYKHGNPFQYPEQVKIFYDDYN